MLLSNHELILEWDWESNYSIGLDGNKVKTGSNKKANWVGKCGHKWDGMSPAQRYYQNQNCPYCSGCRVLPGFNDLVTVNPELAAEWDWDENSCDPNYINPYSHDKAHWICSRCGNKYEAEIKSRNYGSGCNRCGVDKMLVSRISRKIDKCGSLKDVFPDISMEWDYANNDKTPLDYLPYSNQNVSWICRTCGNSYIARISSRTLQKCGCPTCGKAKALIKTKHTKIQKSGTLFEKFPHLVQEWDFVRNQATPDTINAYSNKYAYWICSKCGYKWSAKINSRTSQNVGCPSCASSHGEKIIEDYLVKRNIEYVREHRFADCCNKLPLPFDFYLPKLNTVIEFDGIQHTEPILYFGGFDGLKKRSENDRIKNTYCETNGILIIRISYKDIGNIDEILMSNFN